MKFKNGPTRADQTVEAELHRLQAMPITDLRKRYRELFRTEPPKAFGPDLLRRSIAHSIQEKAYGGLPPTTRRLLDQMVKAASVEAQWPAGFAAADQAGLRTGADLEPADLPREGSGRWLCL